MLSCFRHIKFFGVSVGDPHRKTYYKGFSVGMEAPEVIAGLVGLHPEIRYVKFQEYSPHAIGITQAMKEEPEIPVSKMIRHHPDVGEYAIRLNAEDVTPEYLRDLVCKATERGKALVLCSKVETNEDDTLHIPMLDFECEVSDKNLAKIQDFIVELGESGLILESGRSYHYYSFNAVPYQTWVKFMARTLLFSGFIDSRHIGHRILSGEARLRIAKIEGSDRYLLTPRVVSIVK